MSYFDGLMSPIMAWLQLHPLLALFITFLVSLTESLAIIGSIIPGSVTMTGIGILVGTGVMELKWVLLAAIFGAIAGDSLSYFIGYIYHDRMHRVWPFTRYPDWLIYGKKYFEQHGGKSVLIGRFVGPLRAIIPIIAGMMRMSQIRFLTANIISGILWSLLYILPGVLIGTASNELSPHRATHLILFILGILFFFWFGGFGLRFVIQRIKYYGRHYFHHAFNILVKCFPRLRVLIPNAESNYASTMMLLLSAIGSGFIFSLILWHFDSGKTLNQSILLLMQSFRTELIDQIMTALMAFSDIFTLSMLIAFLSMLLLFCRQFKSAFYFLTIITCAIFALIPLTQTLSQFLIALPLLISCVLYCLLLFFSNVTFSSINAYFFNISLVFMLFFRLIGSLYFGDLEILFTSALFFLGLSFSLFGWVFFRTDKTLLPSLRGMRFLVFIFFLSPIFLLGFNYHAMIREHAIPQFKTSLLDESIWWDQKTPFFPPYRANRFGKPVELLNVQYGGSLQTLEQTLQQKGFVVHQRSFWFALLRRLSGGVFSKAPLLTPLYLNKPPVLIMTEITKYPSTLNILYLWHSGYYLTPRAIPLWTGSFLTLSQEEKNKVAPLNILEDALPQFDKREIIIQQKTTPEKLLLLRLQ